jgi:nucleoside phosphorylase
MAVVVEGTVTDVVVVDEVVVDAHDAASSARDTITQIPARRFLTIRRSYGSTRIMETRSCF